MVMNSLYPIFKGFVNPFWDVHSSWDVGMGKAPFTADFLPSLTNTNQVCLINCYISYRKLIDFYTTCMYNLSPSNLYSVHSINELYKPMPWLQVRVINYTTNLEMNLICSAWLSASLWLLLKICLVSIDNLVKSLILIWVY